MKTEVLDMLEYQMTWDGIWISALLQRGWPAEQNRHLWKTNQPPVQAPRQDKDTLRLTPSQLQGCRCLLDNAEQSLS